MEHHQPTTIIDTGSEPAKTMAAPSKASSRKRLHGQRASQAGDVSVTTIKKGKHPYVHCTAQGCKSCSGQRMRSDHLKCPKPQ